MIERRRFKRYSMPRGLFAILRNELDQLNNHRRMSIGEIAMVLYKSETQVLGQVANISLGGLALDIGDRHMPPVDEVELDLLMTEQGIYLHNIPFTALPSKKTVTKKKDRDLNSQRTVLRFDKLDAPLKNGLRELLAYHIEN